MPSRVLILDAGQRSALAAVRSLGKRGAQIITADASSSTLAGSSKFSSLNLTLPDPRTHHVEFVGEILNAVHTHDIGLVMPMTDVTTMLLVKHKVQIAPAILACANAESYEMLSDKSLLIQRARDLGIPTPRSVFVNSADQVLEAAREYSFPLVLKPSRSRYLHEGKIHSTQVRIAQDLYDLRRIISTSTWLTHIDGIVQQFIPGYGAGVFALGNGHEVVAWFAHRRLREKPPSGGVSVLCESVAVNEQVRDYSSKLLRSVGWLGPAMVEYRIGHDRTPYLMEVNGRFWGSLQLSVDSGVDFPYLLHQLVTGSPAPIIESYDEGRRLRWLLGDFDNLLIQLQTKGAAREKLRACIQFFSTFADLSCSQEIFRWSDPKPALFELKEWFRALN